MYVCMYVCIMCVCMYVYVCMYVCICVYSTVKGYIVLIQPYWCSEERKILECVRVGCAGIIGNACMYVYMYVCMCIYVCMYVYICMYVCVEHNDFWLVPGLPMWGLFEGE